VTPDAELRRPASPRELFTVFTSMALQGFGGVLPVAQHMLVERQRWMTRAQFTETLSIGQVLPGPNVVNLALIVGDRYFGWRGAVAALAGMVGLPLLLVLALAMLYAGFADHPVVAGALRGMGAVAAGLVVAMAFKLATTLRGHVLGPWGCAVVALATFALSALLRWPMAWIVLGVGGAGVAWAWWRLRA
jgi:chromate transporter